MYTINTLYSFQWPFPYNKPCKSKGSSQFDRECTECAFKTNILCAVCSKAYRDSYISKLIVRPVLIHLTHYLVKRIIILVIHCHHKTVRTRSNKSFQAHMRG
jgi:hypothetical protein